MRRHADRTLPTGGHRRPSRRSSVSTAVLAPPGHHGQHRPDEGLGRSRGGRTCKLHLAEEGDRRPLALLITPGRRGDAPQLILVMERIRVGRAGGGHRRTRPDHLGGDRAYSCRENYRYLRRHQVKHTIPKQKNQRANRQPAAAGMADPSASTRRSTSAGTKWSG
ncbi:transposase [Streptomyces huasconensis]|uniref:transposase n=1 Tax=Streptomyces huasconensis TaxID=1854574 RepID=UPI003700E689